jgi:hypothetical protein
MLLTLTLATVLHAAPAADTIPGSWRFLGDISGFPLDQVCTFAQAGTALTGRCTTLEGPGVDIAGEVKEGTITFQHPGEYEGQPLTVAYTGTLASATEMRGTIVVQPFDVSGYFTATPVPAVAPPQPEP